MSSIHEVPQATFQRVARAITAAFHALKSYQYGNASTELAESVARECATAHFMLTGVAIPSSAPGERKPFAFGRDKNGGQVILAAAVPETQKIDLAGDGWFPLYKD